MNPICTPNDSHAFLEALGSPGPVAGRAKELDLYGRFVGSWTMDTLEHLEDGTSRRWDGEIHFAWVLGGHAIQDLWIRPRRPATPVMYGTTLRIFDPLIEGWRITWADPMNDDFGRQVGRDHDGDIVQIGEDSRGLRTRWRFTEITDRSFYWLGEERVSKTDTWRRTWEHKATREPS